MLVLILFGVLGYSVKLPVELFAVDILTEAKTLSGSSDSDSVQDEES